MQIVFTSGMSDFSPGLFRKRDSRSLLEYINMQKSRDVQFTIFHSICVLDCDEYGLKTVGILTQFLFKGYNVYYVSVVTTPKVFDIKENHFAEI